MSGHITLQSIELFFYRITVNKLWKLDLAFYTFGMCCVFWYLDSSVDSSSDSSSV
jgi:hypothetical protein